MSEAQKQPVDEPSVQDASKSDAVAADDQGNKKPQKKHYATMKSSDSTDELHKNMDKMKIQKDEKKAAISYSAEKVIGNGSFGTVYQATIAETKETVAIKKVLQDRRFKNREFQIMKGLNHPNVTMLKHHFYQKGDKDEIFLNLVMEFIPETVHRCIRNHTKAGIELPQILVKIYMYQICRGLAYIHSLGVCHRDIKPQNLLLNSETHIVKLCDFGSAKILVKGEPNVAYICSRYYRAPELVFEATEYTTAIDIWSIGCVMAEMIKGSPLFPGESSVDQLIEILKVLGTPSQEEIREMNPHSKKQFQFPQINPLPWTKVFKNRTVSESAIHLLSSFLQYKPTARVLPFEALVHPFFDELREESVKLPNDAPLPPLFDFTDFELKTAMSMGITEKLIPKHLMANFADQLKNL